MCERELLKSHNCLADPQEQTINYGVSRMSSLRLQEKGLRKQSQVMKQTVLTVSIGCWPVYCTQTFSYHPSFPDMQEESRGVWKPKSNCSCILEATVMLPTFPITDKTPGRGNGGKRFIWAHGFRGIQSNTARRAWWADPAETA